MRLMREAEDWIGRWEVPLGRLPDSVYGMLLTIRSVQCVWERVKPHSPLCTRRLNQDGLENFFSVIRQVNGGNYLPDPTQFRHAYRKSAINSALRPSALSNCEPDCDELMAALSSLAARTTVSNVLPKVRLDMNPPTVSDAVEVDAVLSNVLTYVAGYLVRTAEASHSCAQCHTALTEGRQQAVCDRETLTAMKSFTGLDETDVGNLKLPSVALYELVEAAYGIVQTHQDSVMLGQHVLAKLLDSIAATSQYAVIASATCEHGAERSLMATFIRLQLHQRCKTLSLRAAHKANRPNRKYLSVSSRVRSGS